jgi:hypothetical protein
MSEVIHQVKQYKISQLRKHPNNPRILKDSAYQTLKNSIESNPELLEARPVILSNRTGNLTIIGGNQRFQVVKDLGWLTIPGVLFPDLTEEKEKEIMIRDNVSNGDWDWEKLQQDWDSTSLNDWGLSVPDWDNIENQNKIEDISEKIEQEFKIEISFDNEHQQAEAFDFLIEKGYSCRILTL